MPTAGQANLLYVTVVFPICKRVFLVATTSFLPEAETVFVRLCTSSVHVRDLVNIV